MSIYESFFIKNVLVKSFCEPFQARAYVKISPIFFIYIIKNVFFAEKK